MAYEITVRCAGCGKPIELGDLIDGYLGDEHAMCAMLGRRAAATKAAARRILSEQHAANCERPRYDEANTGPTLMQRALNAR